MISLFCLLQTFHSPTLIISDFSDLSSPPPNIKNPADFDLPRPTGSSLYKNVSM